MARRKKKRPIQPVKVQPKRVSFSLGARAHMVGVDVLATPTAKGNVLKQQVRGVL